MTPEDAGERGDDRAPAYEVAVVGGGPGGLTAALYATRLNHDTVLVDRGGGRAAMMVDTHNVIGVTEETSGAEFLNTALEQLDHYGTDVERDVITSVEPTGEESPRFELETGDGRLFADRVVLATGFNDGRPDPPLPRTGRGLHYCLQCDGYMFVDESVYVMGHGEGAAHVAMIMLNFTDDVDLLLRGDEPTWSDETDRQLRAHPVDIVETEIDEMFKDDEDPTWLGGFEFEDGTTREYKGGFAMYGSEYNDQLVEQLDIERNEDGTLVVDEDGRTSHDGVFAVGDITPGNNQIPIAMGDGAKAGIAIHKELRTYPKPLAEISPEADADAPSQAAGDD
jgi:thioredoxin reductase (NADPH)